MKERLLCCAVLLAALLVLTGRMAANAQSTPTPTPTPTGTPTPTCAISTNPVTTMPIDCRTGAREPTSELGVSGGNYRSVKVSAKTGVTCCTGTFGALVQNTSGTRYVLSTNNVLARTSSNSSSATGGEAIVQPGLTDLGCWQDPTDQVAKLSNWQPLSFGGAENQMDAAIAKVLQVPQAPSGTMVPGVGADMFNIGEISTVPFPVSDLFDGMFVMKMGRTSCLTSGAIDAYDALGRVVYTNTCHNAASGTALFDNQIIVLGEAPGQQGTCTFASPGDSGALVLTQDFSCPQAIGMVFAGASGGGADSGGTIVAVNPIKPILNKFKVSLVGQVCTPSPLEQTIQSATAQPVHISDALRASIESVRSIKELYGRKLLEQPGVVAVGIGAGNTPDSASLKVYVTDDSPALRSAVSATVGSQNVTFRRIAGKFVAF